MRPSLHQLPRGFLENEREKVGLSPFQFAQFQNILRVVIEEPTHPTQKPITIVKSRNYEIKHISKLNRILPQVANIFMGQVELGSISNV